MLNNLQIPEVRPIAGMHFGGMGMDQELERFLSMNCRYLSEQWTYLVLSGWTTVCVDENEIAFMRR
jgi:hypothetical protein